MRDVLVDGRGSLGARFRRRRWDAVVHNFPDIGQMRILDLGGTVDTWLWSPAQPAAVDVLNLAGEVQDPPEWLRVVEGDACDPPDTIRRERYDLVFSNSVIEHVGGHWRRRRFAETVHGAADRHWIQTPSRYFPIEPHYVGPGFQFLPVGVRARVLSFWPLVHTPPRTQRHALKAALETELIGRAELSYLFPDSRIYRERVGGVTKSLAAVRSG